MNRILCTVSAVVIGWLSLPQLAAANSDSRKIDGAHSTITVHVYKSGFLSAFGHNHEIQAPIQSGAVKESDSPSVELRIDARKLQVLDPDASEGSRAQIQDTMQGNRFSTSVTSRKFAFNLLPWNPKAQTIGSSTETWHCTEGIAQSPSR